MSDLAFFINPFGDGVAPNLDTLLELEIVRVGTNELDAVEYYDREQPNQPVIDAFTRELRQRDMTVVTVHGVGGFVAPERSLQGRAMDHLKREVDRAATWESPCLVFHYRQPFMPWTKSEMADWTTAIMRMGVDTFDGRYHEALAQLCEYAAAQNVGVYLEAMGPPFSYGQSLTQMLSTLETVKHENLGICVDTGHLHLSGHHPATQIRMTRGLPLTLHLNDNLGPIPPNYDIYDSDLHLVPGLGTVDWVQVLLALREVDYKGPHIFEGPGYPGSTFKDATAMTIQFWRVIEEVAEGLALRWCWPQPDSVTKT